VKHRQAGWTTLMALWLLVECGLRPGYRGALIAESFSTAQEAFRRILLALQLLPKPIQDLMGAKRSSMSNVEFSHGGGISCHTAGTKTPVIGRSLDRLVLTELGWWRDAGGAMRHIAPTFRARPHARVVIESTPGPEGCFYHDLVKSQLSTTTPDWILQFLSWRDDPWINEKCLGDTEHFKNQIVGSDYGGDDRLFANQYPEDILSGFTGSASPTLPNDILTPLLPGTVLPTDARDLPRGRYILTSDPAGYGETGDPSGLIAWRILGPEQIIQDEAVLLRRLDPSTLAQTIATWVADLRLSKSTVETVVVESNAAGCVQALRDESDIPLYWSGKQTPGWQATASRKGAAISRLVGGLKTKKIKIRSSQVLRHLLSYSATPGARVEGHHQELAVCAYILAVTGLDYLNGPPREERPLEITSVFDQPRKINYNKSSVRKISWR